MSEEQSIVVNRLYNSIILNCAVLKAIINNKKYHDNKNLLEIYRQYLELKSRCLAIESIIDEDFYTKQQLDSITNNVKNALRKDVDQVVRMVYLNSHINIDRINQTLKELDGTKKEIIELFAQAVSLENLNYQEIGLNLY